MDEKISYSMMGKIKSVNGLVKAALGATIDAKALKPAMPKKAAVETTDTTSILLEDKKDDAGKDGKDVIKAKRLSKIAKARRTNIK